MVAGGSAEEQAARQKSSKKRKGVSGEAIENGAPHVNGNGLDVLADLAAQQEEDADAIILWRVNPEEFNRRFRHQVCIDLVTERLGRCVPHCALCKG